MFLHVRSVRDKFRETSAGRAHACSRTGASRLILLGLSQQLLIEKNPRVGAAASLASQSVKAAVEVSRQRTGGQSGGVVERIGRVQRDVRPGVRHWAGEGGDAGFRAWGQDGGRVGWSWC